MTFQKEDLLQSLSSNPTAQVIIVFVLAFVGFVCCIGVLFLALCAKQENEPKAKSNPTGEKQLKEETKKTPEQLESANKSDLPSANPARKTIPVPEAVNPTQKIPKLKEGSHQLYLKDLEKHIFDLGKIVTEPDIVGFVVEYNYVEEQTCDMDKYEFDAATNPDNADKNRYKNVLAPDHSRVVLSRNEKGLDYINANFVGGLLPNTEKAYIAAQGPLGNTTGDFWKMVWETQSTAILMLTKEIEAGRNKCYQYWPAEVNETLTFGDLTITLKKSDTNKDKSLTLREMELKKGKESRIVKQTHYLEWPDHGVPETRKSFLDLVPLTTTDANGKPLVVHCSAGLGRTGTFILVDSVLKFIQSEAKKGKNEDSIIIDVAEVLVQIRKARPLMIQTEDQYEFCYHAIYEGVKKIFRSQESKQFKRQTMNHYVSADQTRMLLQN